MSEITFKISPYIGEILTKISQNQILQISTPTGTGKSLAIPIELHRRKKKVFVIVPTIVATLNLYKTVKERFDLKNVGYAADAKIHYDDSSTLVYVTYGHIINFLHRRIARMKTENPFNFCTHLILDEVHMGTSEMIMIFAYYLYYAKKYETMPRLLMMSATLSGMNLMKQYDIAIWPENNDVFSSEARYRVLYEDTDICLNPSNKVKVDALVKIILQCHEQYPIAYYSDILVFVAGELDIKQVTEKLMKKNVENLLIMNLMSTTEQDDLHYINLPAPEGFRKVIISTNVAETGITVEGVGLVIDSMEAKVPMTSSSGGFLLKRDIISRANAIQRAGRCARAPFPGRSFPYGGIVRCLVTRATFEDTRRFAAALANEMVRTPIYNHVLNIYSHGLRPADLELQTPLDTLTNADLLLKQYKLIDHQFKVTNAGKFVVHCPLTIDMATALFFSLQDFRESRISPDQQLSGLISIACLISSCDRGYLMNPKDPAEKEEAMKIHEKYRSSSALKTMSLILNDYLQVKGKIASQMATYKWCKKNFISAKEFSDLIRSIRLTLLMCGKNFRYQPFNFKASMKLFYPRLIQIKSNYLMQNQGRFYQYVTNPDGKYMLNNFNSLVSVKTSRRIYALIIKSFADNGIMSHRIICWIYEEMEKKVVKAKVVPQWDVILDEEEIIPVKPSVQLNVAPSQPIVLMSTW